MTKSRPAYEANLKLWIWIVEKERTIKEPQQTPSLTIAAHTIQWRISHKYSSASM